MCQSIPASAGLARPVAQESGFPQRPGTIPPFPRDLFRRGQFHEGAVMGGLYLGIAVTGVNALVATGLVIALM